MIAVAADLTAAVSTQVTIVEINSDDSCIDEQNLSDLD